MKLLATLSTLALAGSALAHGFITKMIIDGKSYPGVGPGVRANKNSPIRQITTINPTYGANNKATVCGPGAKWAPAIANASPGSKVTVYWGSFGNYKWPHDTGPIQTYLASCGNTPCNKFPAMKAKWFKIQQNGRKANGKWAQADFMNGGPAPAVTLPSNLKAGNYLMRHEVIALHLARTKGRAEYYTNCVQLRVGGNKKGVPQAKDLVSFPGAYKDTDPGLFGKSFWTVEATYKFPGPKVATLVSPANAKRSVGSGSVVARAAARSVETLEDSDSASDVTTEDLPIGTSHTVPVRIAD